MKKFAGKYRIPSARASWWDYANDGAYFVTICTAQHACCFGDVEDGEMHFSALGEIANNIWDEIPRQFPYAELGVYQVMPNHVHGILVINRTKCGDAVEKRDDVETNDGKTINGVTRNDEINDGKTNVGETRDGCDTRDDGTRDDDETRDGCDMRDDDETRDGCDTRDDGMRDDGDTRGGCDTRDVNTWDGCDTFGCCDVRDVNTWDGCDTRGCRDAINRVSTIRIAGIIASNAKTIASNAETNAFNAETNASNVVETPGGITGNHNPMLHDNLSRILRWYKGRVTFDCHQTDADFAWQARFHDIIIRDTASFTTISEYIIHNPAKWNADKFNPANT